MRLYSGEVVVDEVDQLNDNFGNLFNTSSRRNMIFPIDNGCLEEAGAGIGKVMRRKVRHVSIYRLNDVSRRAARQAPFDRVLFPLPRIKLKQKLKEKARIHALSIQFDLGDGSIKKIECGAQV